MQLHYASVFAFVPLWSKFCVGIGWRNLNQCQPSHQLPSLGHVALPKSGATSPSAIHNAVLLLSVSCRMVRPKPALPSVVVTSVSGWSSGGAPWTCAMFCIQVPHSKNNHRQGICFQTATYWYFVCKYAKVGSKSHLCSLKHGFHITKKKKKKHDFQ